MKNRWFKITLLVFTLLCVLVSCVLLHFLWSAMVDFEAASEIGAIGEYFDNFARGDYSAAAETSGFPFDEKSTKEEYISYLKSVFGSDFSDLRFSETESNVSGEKLYAIYNGMDYLGDVRLIPQQGQSRNWRVVAVTQYADPLLLEVPDFVTVSANGIVQIPLPGETPVMTEFSSLTDYPNLPCKVSYRLEGYLFSPEISFQSPNGTDCITAREEDGKICVSVIPTGSREQQCRNLLVEFSQVYARYISRDADLEELAEKLKQDTALYESILSYDTKYVISHTGYEFRNVEVSDVIWGGDYFVGTVQFDYIVFRGKTEYAYPSQYRLTFAKEQGHWVVVDMTSL